MSSINVNAAVPCPLHKSLMLLLNFVTVRHICTAARLSRSIGRQSYYTYRKEQHYNVLVFIHHSRTRRQKPPLREYINVITSAIYHQCVTILSYRLVIMRVPYTLGMLYYTNKISDLYKLSIQSVTNCYIVGGGRS